MSRSTKQILVREKSLSAFKSTVESTGENGRRHRTQYRSPYREKGISNVFDSKSPYAQRVYPDQGIDVPFTGLKRTSSYNEFLNCSSKRAESVESRDLPIKEN